MAPSSEHTLRSAAPRDPKAVNPDAVVLTGGTVVDLAPPRVEIADVVIEGDRIVQVGGECPRGAVRVDARGCVVTTAFVNAHTHLYLSLTRGMPPASKQPLTFVDLISRVWWKLDKALDEELIRLSALVGAVDSVKRGVATVLDHHSSPRSIDGSLDVIAAALDEVGVRGVLCYETSDRDGRGRRDGGLKENERFLARARKVGCRHRGLVGAHASFTLNDDTLDAIKDLADRTGAGIHMHVAEDPNDEKDAARKKGAPLAARLKRLGLARKGSIVAQAVHLDAKDAEWLMKAGAWIVTNPRSNMLSSVGLASVEGDRVALGTDGVDCDVLAEVQAHYFRHLEARDGLATETVRRLVAGQRLASFFFGDGDAPPKIERGGRADLAVLEYDASSPMTPMNLEDHAVLGFPGARVRHTILGGRFLLRDRVVQGIDEDKLRADARVAAGRLWERMQGYL
jgi:cytosine/adenosine deaminase-related metal-dependent hydrolase